MQGCEASTAPCPTMPHRLLSFRNSISCKGLKAVRGNSEMGKKRGPCLVISSPESPGAPGQKLLSLEWVQVCLPLDFSVLSSSHLSSEHGDGLGNGFLSAHLVRLHAHHLNQLVGIFILLPQLHFLGGQLGFQLIHLQQRSGRFFQMEPWWGLTLQGREEHQLLMQRCKAELSAGTKLPDLGKERCPGRPLPLSSAANVVEDSKQRRL